ncbi:MAG: alpha/beta hydrolase [Candidatus Pacebacteria bacterium]|nr:alpha/beta hydrolase [Candidatus Paceibacterota bacterium]MBP9851330.1 alpha/beta hydrolase [Candidatus Paceibacterota bacterium]
MKVIVDNLVTEYEDEGAGKVLLFLHGWKDSLDSFNDIGSILNSEYRVIRLDLPGFGKTQIPKETWDLDDYIDFVGSFIAKLNISPYALIGHSFGGRIIIKGVSERKLNSEKLVLVASAGIAKRKTLKNYVFKIIAKTGKLVTYIPPFYFYRNSLKKKLYSFVGGDYLNTGALKNTFVKVIKEDLSEYARQIEVPTILIWGADDTETPLSDGQRLNTMIRNSRLEVLEKADHFVHKQKPREVSGLIREFLR